LEGEGRGDCNYPLISRRSISFNPRPKLSASQDTDPRLELEFYAARTIPEWSGQRMAKEFFAGPTTLSPFDPSTYGPLLAS
jgi:hypothetical protein